MKDNRRFPNPGRGIVMFIAAAVLMMAAWPASAIAPGPAPDHIHLSWQSDPATTMTVMWRTSEGTTDSVVQYGLNESYGQQVAGTSYTYGSQGARAHVVEIAGLEPDTLYHYRCGSPSAGWSNDSTFVTAINDPCTPLRFVVMGDSRSDIADGASDIWTEVIEAAYQEGPDFYFFTGDAIKEGDSETGWDTFFEKAVPYLAFTPLIVTWGNHEDRGDSLFLDMFAMPTSGIGGENFFTLDFPGAHMIVLDTEHGAASYLAQKAWMDTDLAGCTARWVFAYFHRPAYSSGTTHGNEPEVQQYFVPIFDKYAVDIVFTSHDHIFERTFPIRNDEKANSPLEGTTYYVSGGAGAFMNPIGGWQWFTAKFFAEHHYVLVEIDYNEITLTAKKRNGDIVDVISWEKGFAPDPVAEFTVTPNPVRQGDPATFDGSASTSCAKDVVAWVWDFGDGDVGEGIVVQHVYAAPGEYRVELTVTDERDENASVSATVIVEESAGDDDDDDDDLLDDDSEEGDDDDDACGC